MANSAFPGREARTGATVGSAASTPMRSTRSRSASGALAEDLAAAKSGSTPVLEEAPPAKSAAAHPAIIADIEDLKDPEKRAAGSRVAALENVRSTRSRSLSVITCDDSINMAPEALAKAEASDRRGSPALGAEATVLPAGALKGALPRQRSLRSRSASLASPDVAANTAASAADKGDTLITAFRSQPWHCTCTFDKSACMWPCWVQLLVVQLQVVQQPLTKKSAVTLSYRMVCSLSSSQCLCACRALGCARDGAK